MLVYYSELSPVDLSSIIDDGLYSEAEVNRWLDKYELTMSSTLVEVIVSNDDIGTYHGADEFDEYDAEYDTDYTLELNQMEVDDDNVINESLDNDRVLVIIER